MYMPMNVAGIGPFSISCIIFTFVVTKHSLYAPPLLLPAPDRKSAMKLADEICEHTVNTHHVVGRDAELCQGKNKGK
jgi:hypothetical protein